MFDDTHVGFFGASAGPNAWGLVMDTTSGGVGLGTTTTANFARLDVNSSGFVHAVRGVTSLGIGVWGVSSFGTGVYGGASGAGAGVEGSSTDGNGLKGSSTNGAGVSATSNSGVGVAGNSSSNDGIVGTAHVGGKSGVYGQGDNGANGVAGITDSGNGVYGSSDSNTGVNGNSSTATGVIGTGKFGVSGFGHAGGFGGYFKNVDAGEIALFVEGTGRVNVLQVAGSDVAEHFDVVKGAKPGLVVAIDPDHPGRLSIARSAYNRRVAGVISGANKLDAGMVLSDLPGSKNSLPVALSGRVWVYCDAAKHPIAPGDLLTTSDTPGHAIKVTNHAKARRAIIGKAMTGLKSGRGLVLVLVTLQ